MDIDKKIISDIKAIFIALFDAGLNLWKNKLKIAKWLVIVIALFLIYKVYKILTVHHVVQNHIVISKTIHVKKSGYYSLVTYIKPKTVYFHKRRILAGTKGLHALSGLTVRHYLYAYKSKILLNKKNIDKFNKDRYRHLIYRSKITGKESHPFILFYVSFTNPDLPDRIIYTPVNIPVKNVLRDYTVYGKFGDNGYIQLTKNPNKKKPEVSLTKFLYLYPQFTIKGKVKYVKAYIKYKIKNKKYYSERFNLSDKRLINLYGIFKNKKSKHWRDARIIKIYFVVKKYKKIKGSVKFTNLDLIYPNYMPLKKVFESFVYKRYLTYFIKKSRLFNKILKKEIKRSKKSGVFVSAKIIKQALIHKTLNEIFLVDYDKKIKHISHIKNKMIRHFYRFIYKKYLTEQNFFSRLLPYFNKPKHFYKNILIPIGSKGVVIKTRKEFNGNTSHYTKTTYIYIHFNKLKLYKYWSVHKPILKKILKRHNIATNNPLNSFILRGNNSDYWRGKHYYKRYPIFKGLRIFAFDKKINKISGYFYYRSLPIKYPKFLSFSKKLQLNNKNKINFFNFTSNKFTYKNQLKLINSFNLNPSGFLKKLLFTSIILKNIKVINIVKENNKIKHVLWLANNSFFLVANIVRTYNSKRFILNFKNINISKMRYGLMRFYIKVEYNEKLLKNFLKLRCSLVNFKKIKKIVPIKYYLLNDSLFFALNLKNINLKNVNKIIISFKQKQIAIPYRYNFRISKNIYLINYVKFHIPLLNIIKNSPLFKLNNNKIFLKNYTVSFKKFNKIFKNGGSFISKKIYLKKGNYNIQKVHDKIFKIKIVSLEKIKNKTINYAKLNLNIRKRMKTIKNINKKKITK